MGYFGTPRRAGMRGLGYTVGTASDPYLAQLENLRSAARTYLSKFRADLTAWQQAANAAGVGMGSQVAVLTSANAWDQSTADLVDISIPREIMRVQNGGAPGDITLYKWTMPPALPSVAGIVSAQGGPQAIDTVHGTSTPSVIDAPTVEVAPIIHLDPPSQNTVLALANTAPGAVLGVPGDVRDGGPLYMATDAPLLLVDDGAGGGVAIRPFDDDGNGGSSGHGTTTLPVPSPGDGSLPGPVDFGPEPGAPSLTPPGGSSSTAKTFGVLLAIGIGALALGAFGGSRRRS